MRKVSGVINSLLNSLSLLFFLPIFAICFLFPVFYRLFNCKFDFESGLEFVYNISVFCYVISIMSFFAYIIVEAV